jgi:S1-C subfamily serine protease
MKAAAMVVTMVVVFLSGCGPRVVLVDRGPQAYYQTGYPVHDTSRELERAFRSLRRVTYSAAYETYLFAPDAGVTQRDLADPATLLRAAERFSDVTSKTGTAVIVARSTDRAALVTNHHVVRFPPTVVHYFDEDRARLPRSSRRVASVAVLNREWGLLADHHELGAFEVLARDTAQDIAIIEIRLPEGIGAAAFRPIAISPGDPRQLSWGSFLYVLGFPSRYAMVTRALVSDPNRDRQGGFLSDGLWNEGISGGVILAVRGDDGALEWVGMTRAGAGTREVRLQPRADEPLEDDVGLLYDGPIYLEHTLRIQYGITFSVPMISVRNFLEQHRIMLQGRGYDLRRF